LRFSFIVNPVSRSGLRIFREFSKIIEEHGYQYEYFITERRGHARDLVREIKGDVILVAGGDGTLNEVVNGVIENKIDIFIAPIFGGTGCDVARSLNVKRDLRKRVLEILKGEIKEVHPALLKTSEGFRYFVGVSDVGFGAEVAYRFNGLRRFGRFGYAIGVLNTLYELKPIFVEMEVGEINYKGYTILIAFANSPYFGGGMKISPNSSITGDTRVIVVEYVPKWKFVYYFPKVYSGKHINLREVKEFEAEKLKVITEGIPVECEGEFAGYPPAHYEVRRDITIKFL